MIFRVKVSCTTSVDGIKLLTNQVNNQSIPSTDVIQVTVHVTLEDELTALVVETSVTVNNSIPIQDYDNPGIQTQRTYKMTPSGFKPFTV